MAEQPPPPNLFYDPNLPPGPYFTLGRMPTREEAAARRRERERAARRVQRLRRIRSRPAAVAASNSVFLHPITAVEQQFHTEFTSIPLILRWLPRWFLAPGMETGVLGLLQHPPAFFEFMCKFQTVQGLGEHTRYLSLAIMILRMRWAFKRLVNAFLIRSIGRRCPLSDTDPITLEPMTNPVVIYSVPTRWRYAYDPTSLIAHIRTQLSTCIYGYPDPQAPRNPITNVEFTIAQLYSAYLQLMTRGKQCWQLGAYLNEGASIERYSRQFVVPIYRGDCVREALDVTNMDGTVTVSEFVYNTISAMKGVNIGHIYVTLEQAFYLPRLRTHPYLSAWRKLYARSLVECSSISVDMLVLMHGNDASITELAAIANKLVRCFPAFFEDVKPILEQSRVERATQRSAQ
jgi:hypothetical protein